MTPRPLVIINIVGLTQELLGTQTPHLNRLIADGFCTPLKGIFPSLTCSAQATMLTGALPNRHGIVANGWYFRDQAEIRFWHQSNHLMHGEKVWEAARNISPDLTCAQLFWWYNMYATVDWSITPRPIYRANGRKLPALYSHPDRFHESIENGLGPFPFFNFWGPKAGIESSRWIANCAKKVFDEQRPAMSLVYLPHLDYNLQRLGPSHPEIGRDVEAIDRVAGELIEHCRAHDADIMVVSEYGIEQVGHHVPINRLLREAGLLSIRDELGTEILDAGVSRAFAVTDHQIAHIYIADRSDIPRVRQLLAQTTGIADVLDEADQPSWGIDHPNSGELIAVAEPGYWFPYIYWLDDDKAPDFARTVDIHRKPGYDPAELFLDPKIPFPKLKVAWRLLQMRLNIRCLLDVIPLTPDLVKGSHGRLVDDPRRGPILISSRKDLASDQMALTDIKPFILRHWAASST